MQVVSQFDELVEEGHVAHDALFKIFTKKIKRSKKKDQGTACHSLLPQHLSLDAITVDQANAHSHLRHRGTPAQAKRIKTFPGHNHRHDIAIHCQVTAFNLEYPCH